MTTVITNVSDLQSMTVSQLRPMAQTLQLPGAWKATKSDLITMLTDHYSSVTETEVAALDTPATEFTQVNHPLSDNDLDDIQVTTVPQVTPVTNESPEAPQTTKKANKQPKVAKDKPKIDKSLGELQKVTTQHLEFIEGMTRPFQGLPEEDTGKLVVKRAVIISILEGELNVHIPEKIFNQVVVLASRKLPRMSFTVKSTGSRFNYLLAEVSKEGQEWSPAVQVLEYTLRNPSIIEEAKANYQVAAREGSITIQEWMDTQKP